MTTRLAVVRTRWAAVGAAVAITLGAVGLGGLNIASAEISSGDRPVFVPINPCRLVDTRPGSTIGAKSDPLGPGEVLTVTAHGENGECTGESAIPTDAIGLSLNVTALGQTQRTFLTLWGGGDDPGTSNLNPEPGQPPTPNAVNTPLSTTGTFNIRNNAGEVNALVDVVGYYAGHNHDDLYFTEGESDNRFERSSSTLLIGPHEFHNRGPITSGTNWTWRDGVADRAATSPDDECIQASFDFPHDVEVTSAELVYFANADVSIEVDVDGLQGVPGAPDPGSEGFQKVASTTATLPATSEEALGGFDLELGPDSSAIDTSRFNYTAEVCASGQVAVYGLRLTLAAES